MSRSFDSVAWNDELNIKLSDVSHAPQRKFPDWDTGNHHKLECLHLLRPEEYESKAQSTNYDMPSYMPKLYSKTCRC